MKKYLIVFLILLSFVESYGQENLKNNGYNLKNYCVSDDCLYFKFTNAVKFPSQSEDPDWQMSNTEVAIKKTGGYILTGDLAILGYEMGARLNFEIQFFDENNQLIHTEQSGLFEFYSEPQTAEPFVLSGSLAKDISSRIDFIDFITTHSEVVPYYELDSDCYGPCKNSLLNVSLKEFKKIK